MSNRYLKQRELKPPKASDVFTANGIQFQRVGAPLWRFPLVG